MNKSELQKQIEEIVRVSFKMGQEWAITCSYFTPSEQDTQHRIDRAIQVALNNCNTKLDGTDSIV